MFDPTRWSGERKSSKYNMKMCKEMSQYLITYSKKKCPRVSLLKQLKLIVIQVEMRQKRGLARKQELKMCYSEKLVDKSEGEHTALLMMRLI